MKRIGLLIFVIVSACSLHAGAQTIMTIAGNGVAGYNGDTIAATSAELFGPYGVAIDGQGNKYIIDQQNQRIRKVDAAGTITTICGTGVAGFSGDSGLAVNAQIHNPWGITVDVAGNVYIADFGNDRVRKIDQTGIITTIAGTGTTGFSGDGGPAVAAKITGPSGVAADIYGNVYFADRGNQRIRKIDTAGIINTIAGNGQVGYNGDNWPSATQASLNYPIALALDNTGNIFVADEFNQRIRKIDTFNKISTVVDTALSDPNGVALDSIGDIFISNEGNYRIIKVVAANNHMVTVAGDGVSGYNGDSSSALTAEIGDCKGLAVDNSGNVYFADYPNNRVNMVTSTVSVPAVYQNISGVSIYPNPSAGVFMVNITSNDNEQAAVVITNVLGETVRNMSIATNKTQSIDLDVAAGVYFFTATTANGKWNGKLVVAAK